MMGICSVEEDRYPVSWISIKPGREIGLAYSLKEYRRNNFNITLRQEIISAFIPTKLLFVTLGPSYSHLYAGCVGHRCAFSII